jgi:hypothetical protein
MQLYVNIRPDLPDGGPFAEMNPGSGTPFGVILFGDEAYVSVKTDDEARRIIEAASATIAMRKMIGTPHAFKPAGPGSVVQPRSCTECGMLGDSPDHAEPCAKRRASDGLPCGLNGAHEGRRHEAWDAGGAVQLWTDGESAGPEAPAPELSAARRPERSVTP